MDKVMFLGKEYTFPHELYEYILYCRKFQNDRERLLLLIMNRTQEKVYSFPDTEIEKLLQDSCRHTIRFLGEAGVYNITEEDLLSSNSAFRKFKDLQDEAVQKMTEIGKLSEKEFKEGFEREAENAASQVTGSGYALISSSIIAHMAFAAMESSTIQSQEAKARRSLQASVAALQNQTNADKKQREWAYVCVEVYLDDKEKVLIEAFKSCPYNVEVYQKLVDMDLLDSETEKTLILYEQKEALVSSIHGSLKVICILKGFMPKKEDIQIYKNNLEWFSLLQGVNRAQAEEQCFHEIRESVRKAFLDMESLLDASDIRAINDQMRRVNSNNIPEYVSKVCINCGAEVYDAVCGEQFLLSLIASGRVKADTYSSYKDAIIKALSDKEKDLYSKKKTEIEAEEKKKKSKKRKIKMVFGTVAAAIVLYFGGTSAYRTYQKKDIDKQCAAVDGSEISLNTSQFTEAKWIRDAKVTVSANITYNTKGDYYEWNMDISETVTLNEEYKSQDEAEQDRIFASIRKEAYDITSSALEETFPRYYKYYDMADDVMSDDWDKLKKIYGNGVFHRGDMKVYIGTENEERLY